MYDWAQALVNLQNLDIQIGQLEEGLAQIPLKIAEAQKLYASENAEYEAAKKNVQDAELGIRAAEKNIAAINEQKRNFQSKTAIIKSNDEYKAALIQIEMCDKQISEAETNMLTSMDALDALKAVLKEKSDSLAAAKKHAEDVCRKFKDEEAAAKAKIAELQAQRPELSSKVDDDILSKYEKLRTAKRHKATKPVLVSVNDGCCGCCHIAVTSQVLNNTHKGQVVYCGSCGAMLYYE